MAGNDTITSATQNLVIAFNSINKTLQYINGQLTSDAYPVPGIANALILRGRGRVVAINVLATGGDVQLYDSSEATITPTSGLRYVLDSTATTGRYEVSTEFKNGIVLSLSGSASAAVTYSVY